MYADWQVGDEKKGDARAAGGDVDGGDNVNVYAERGRSTKPGQEAAAVKADALILHSSGSNTSGGDSRGDNVIGSSKTWRGGRVGS